MFKVLDEQVNNWNVLEITEGDFKGCRFTLGEISFADEPNADGTYTVTFEYNIVNDYNVTNTEELKETLGDIVNALLVSSAEHAEYLLKGGVDDEKN